MIAGHWVQKKEELPWGVALMRSEPYQASGYFCLASMDEDCVL